MNSFEQIVLDTDKISIEFSKILKSWNSKEEMQEIIKRNQLPAYKEACASHDFCDANIAMEEAFEKAMGREFVFGDDVDTSLWNASWHKAKINNFYFDISYEEYKGYSLETRENKGFVTLIYDERRNTKGATMSTTGTSSVELAKKIVDKLIESKTVKDEKIF